MSYIFFLIISSIIDTIIISKMLLVTNKKKAYFNVVYLYSFIPNIGIYLTHFSGISFGSAVFFNFISYIVFTNLISYCFIIKKTERIILVCFYLICTLISEILSAQLLNLFFNFTNKNYNSFSLFGVFLTLFIKFIFVIFYMYYNKRKILKQRKLKVLIILMSFLSILLLSIFISLSYITIDFQIDKEIFYLFMVVQIILLNSLIIYIYIYD